MSKDKNLIAIILAILAAALYAISTPVSKVMLQTVAPTMVAAFLYLGAGIGMGAMMLVRSGRHRTTEERLHRSDIPYAVAMVVLDIAAPILMMYGLKTCSASNTSLLNNFEIVATALIALLFFGESVKRKLWIAIMLVTVASILLSLEDGNMSEAQRTIGAAKTSTYYALAPFIGALLSILLLGESVTMIFIIASILMAAGCWIAAK